MEPGAEEQGYARADAEATFQAEMAEQEQQAAEEGNGPFSWVKRVQTASSPKAVDQAPGTRKEVITLDEGDIVISFPDALSAASVANLSDHLELFIRKAQRRAKAAESQTDEAAH